jgi:Uma2 family endonuclease
MRTATANRRTRKAARPVVGPHSNGIILSPEEFDRADFEDGWRYELINGVLVVSPIPSPNEADPNDELGYLLRSYQEHHPQGATLDLTLPERIVKTGANRRRADRLIWAGLGRLPRRGETPTITAEFVSPGRSNRLRDYEIKRDEYLAIGIQEYWIFDRFDDCLVVFKRQGNKVKKRVLRHDQTYRTPLLPGFELPVGRLLDLATRWGESEDATEEGS